eukprot:1403999-Rhodomonas_salina.1
MFGTDEAMLVPGRAADSEWRRGRGGSAMEPGTTQPAICLCTVWCYQEDQTLLGSMKPGGEVRYGPTRALGDAQYLHSILC